MDYLVATPDTPAVKMAISVTADPADPGHFCFVVTGHTEEVAITCESDSYGTCCAGGGHWLYDTDTEGKCGNLSEQTADAVVTCTIDGTSISDSTTVTFATAKYSTLLRF